MYSCTRSFYHLSSGHLWSGAKTTAGKKHEHLAHLKRRGAIDSGKTVCLRWGQLLQISARFSTITFNSGSWCILKYDANKFDHPSLISLRFKLSPLSNRALLSWRKYHCWKDAPTLSTLSPKWAILILWKHFKLWTASTYISQFFNFSVKFWG